MNYKLFGSIYMFVFLPVFLYCQQEFIKPKVTKQKKETVSDLKENVGDLLEIVLRQLGSNIQQSVVVQNQVIDQIKMLMNNNTQSNHQLKELRNTLEKYLKKLEEQQVDLQSFLLLCK